MDFITTQTEASWFKNWDKDVDQGREENKDKVDDNLFEEIWSKL